MRTHLTLAFALTVWNHCLLAQDSGKWDVNNPPGEYKEVSFSVSEGTWMNLDLSPDGQTLVFDLLGDIYSMPSAGGEAKVIRSGHAFEVQPRFSPDGTKILFTSDAGGGDNCWVMDRDGKNAHQITSEDFRLLNNGVWTPDGEYIIARKHFTSQRSLGAGELWMYHISGGKGLQLTTRKNDQQDLNEPCVSPDGRYIYFSEDAYPGGFFQYNKDPNNQIFVIRRYDRERGIIENVTGGPGGACRPQLSRDGTKLAFVKRVRTKTVLMIRDLETAEEWPVYDMLSKDQQEAWTIFGIYTGYNWSPDDKYIYVWAQGKINKVDANAFNSSTNIPFRCEVKQRIYETARFSQDLNPDSVKLLVCRQVVSSPDGKWVVYNAAGHLWKKELPDGSPTRISDSYDFEFEPSFTRKGGEILFVRSNDQSSSQILSLNILDPGSERSLTSEKANYRNPSLSPDGKWIVFQKSGTSDLMGPAYTSKPGIYIMPSDGGEASFVTNKGNNPAFNANSDRIYYQSGGGMNVSLNSCKPDGSDERQHLKSTYGSGFTISPDEKWVAFIDLHKVYIASFPQTGKVIDLGSSTKDFPVKQVAKDAGFNLHWSKDSKTLHYTLANEYFSVNIEDRFEFVAGRPDSLFTLADTGVDISPSIAADKPLGYVAFTGARILTMHGNEIIEDGTLLVKDNKIEAIGKRKDIKIPVDAQKIDCRGKTILPGFIDAHAHGGHFQSGPAPRQFWPYYANLAYGVTTMHDPSANTEWVFAQSELQKTGEIVGPRIFSTGTILYGADGNFKALVNKLDDALSAIRRTKAFGAFSVKSYNQPRREQRQMIMEAAKQLKIEVVPEGGSFFYHNISMILDGHTTIEHNLPVALLYDDVIQLWKEAKTAYTPTLIVSYGSASGEYYWYQHSDIWTKKRLSRFTPREVLDTRSRHRTMMPEEEYENGHILVSKSLKKLSDAGVLVNSGAHGQLQGLGYHWEIWMMAQGGMSNHEALRTATVNPAKSLGLDRWIGSLEPGKLADLLVLDKNPLENIRNTESIRYTMVNGHLYDADSMWEIGNYKREVEKFGWELYKNANVFPMAGESMELGHCLCGKH